MMLTLGIETSCDETSAALVHDHSGIIANSIYTQDIHARYGGVVPEMASRAHIQKVDRLCEAVLHEAGLRPRDLDLLAVTDRPGLAGALLVGVSFALGMHCGQAIPITGVNHLEGHIASVLLEHPDLAFPFLALVVSGGHTALYQVTDFGSYRLFGQTIDDAAGEAFDKVGKMLGFAYPAGRAIEQEAARYAGDDVISFPIARVQASEFHFSFSGLKTAVKYYVQKHGMEFAQRNRPMICYSFQKALVDSLVRKTCAAARASGLRAVALVGGVACNGALRTALRDEFGDALYFPSPGLCTDNAAMIARAGYENVKRGVSRFPSMRPSAPL
jgi:N6-L-threonylcarbamoyladenine synthase